MDQQTELIFRQLEGLIKSGRIIQAIKLARTAKGMNLKDAKEFVEQFRDQVDQAKFQRQDLREQGFEPPSYSDERLDTASRYQQSYQHSHRHKIEKDLPTEVYLLLQQGEKVQAIKALRDIKGLNLNQANSLIAQFYAENPQYTFSEEKTKSRIIPFLIFAGFSIYIFRQMFT